MAYDALQNPGIGKFSFRMGVSELGQSRHRLGEDRFSELADCRKIHMHCNVPRRNCENAKLGTWVGKQRANYKLNRRGKTSPMSTYRIQALESLGLE